MKYISLSLFILFGSCQMDTVTQPTVTNYHSLNGLLDAQDLYMNGMHYYIIERSGGGVCVINITLDSLNLIKLTK